MEQSNNNGGKQPNFAAPDPAALEQHWDRFDLQAAMFENDFAANQGRPTIIAIHGLAGAGKSAMAEAFRKQCRDSVVIPLASPIKNIAASMGWRGQKDEKGRKLLQQLGTELAMDLIDKDRWTKMWVINAHSVRFCKLIICDDMRFPHEMALFKRLKAKTVKITGRGGIVGTHRSEAGLKGKFNYEYSNTGDLRTLDVFVNKVLTDVLI